MIITVANTRRSLNWLPAEMSVSELWARIERPVRGTETVAEYLRLPKAQQDDLKDVAGGFVGGQLQGHRRKANAVTGRDLVTLDFDTIPPFGAQDLLSRVQLLGVQYGVYSTRKHRPEAPRLRVLIPLARTVTADEYEPVARRVAEMIGITRADPTTFEACRLMYWPTVCADGEYICHHTDIGPLLDPDAVLATYADWHDMRSWPQVPGAVNLPKLAAQQQDPTAKDGVVGAFCREYDVIAAMDLIPGLYAPAGEGRYTYTGGSTAGGAIIYGDGKWLYSHHATDPCGGQLVNAFDMVRLNKFAQLDDAAAPDTPTNKLPSYEAMCRLATEDDRVAARLIRERREQAQQDFAPVAEDADWERKLDLDKQGNVRGTIDNVRTILLHDPALKGAVAYDTFHERRVATRALPWGGPEGRHQWTDADLAGLYWYMELRYGVVKRPAIDAGLDTYCLGSTCDDLVEYIGSLAWDGVERLDTLFTDYLGAQDTPYTRAVCRKSFTAAVARALDPGCKYDQMVILCGPQGIGKSTLLGRMGHGWFDDNISDFTGKDAAERLRGVWLVEVAELDAMYRTEVSHVKQFLSQREDIYRAAYGKNTISHPRRCVFYGTCNQREFLRDSTGNRRFWVVDTAVCKADKAVWEDLTDHIRDQLWAEAKVRYEAGESLRLPPELEEEARRIQERHADHDPMEGQIREFVDRLIPEDWDRWPLDKRLAFWAQAEPDPAIRLVPRQRICSMEIWRELLGQTRQLLKRGSQESRSINAILESLPDWEAAGLLTCGCHGMQRAYKRRIAVKQ